MCSQSSYIIVSEERDERRIGVADDEERASTHEATRDSIDFCVGILANTGS